jgi:hypothetical protein
VFAECIDLPTIVNPAIYLCRNRLSPSLSLSPICLHKRVFGGCAVKAGYSMANRPDRDEIAIVNKEYCFSGGIYKRAMIVKLAFCQQ